jgi:hypothetical protein
MNSKRIGSNYEREIARKLSKWISGKEDPLICWRNVHSGTISTVDKKKGLSGANTEGDFQCLDLEYNYMFETFCFDSKCYKECNPYFINSKNIKSNSILNQWIKVCKESGNKIPIMICKIRDQKTPEFAIMPNNISFPDSIPLITYIFNNAAIRNFSLIMLTDLISNISAYAFYLCNKDKIKRGDEI